MPALSELTTPETLSEEAVNSYHEQGFVHLPRVFDDDEVTSAREAAEELLEKHGPQLWGVEGAVQVHYVEAAWRKDERLRAMALHPRITGIAERLSGGPLRLYGTDVLAKEPHEHLSTVIHDDEAGLPLSGLSRTLTAWIALVDVTVERGCLTFVPGSHRRTEADRLSHVNSFDEYREMEDVWPEFLWRPRVSVPVRAGDVTFHHFRTVHMAGTNDTDQRRLSFAAVYMDADARYRPGVQDHPVAHLEPGQLVEGDEFPLIAPARNGR